MIDFKNGMESETGVPSENKTKKSTKIFRIIGVIAILFIIFAGKVIVSGSGSDSWFNTGIFSKITHIVTSSNKKLIGEENDRINVLLIGMGGKNHDGGYLADTIMLVSIKPSTKQVSMISIPRDMAVKVSDGYWRKINSINATAEAKQTGSGGPAMTAYLSDLLGTPITYYVRADFQGFVNIVDELGGVTVNVEHTLDDYSYPILGEEDNPNYYSRYQHLHVDAGLQKMDGSLALKFARSRHGVGGEGSDFARARRQQLILQAVKDNLLSANTLLKPAMLVRISNQLKEHVDTNISVTDMIALWDDYKSVEKSNIINKVLDNGADGLLVNTTGADGAYLLMPRTGNYDEIKSFTQNIFGTAPAPKVEVKPLSKSVNLQIVNGTWVTGLASKIGSTLDAYNFTTTKSNGSERNITKSAIYDLSYGKNEAAIKALTDLTGATLSYDSPTWLTNLKNSTSTPDLVLILGTDAEKWELTNPQQ
jgi:cell envelope-related function transcriptional attenuator common domain